MKYIAYVRKSADEKDKQILSIDQQVAELKEYASKQNLEILDFVCEARTAKTIGRPLFAEMLKRIESGDAQGIVSWHPDRLARNSKEKRKIIRNIQLGFARFVVNRIFLEELLGIFRRLRRFIAVVIFVDQRF